MTMQSSILSLSSLNDRARLRLLLAAVIGLTIALFLVRMDFITRALIGWDAALVVLLLGAWRMMAKTTVSQLKRKAAQADESATIILGLMIAAIAASLVGVVGELRNARHAGEAQSILFVSLSLVSLVLSWFTMQVLFATHYAHRYYGDQAVDSGDAGLSFPENGAAPSYSEFLYFALCIGMTYQVSDITTRTRAFRQLVAFHGATSFFFNTFVLALAVNLLSGLGSIV
jgi:uncharacterized membrane protein